MPVLVSIKDLLEHLDGDGIVFTDEALAARALAEIGLSLETEIAVPPAPRVVSSETVDGIDLLSLRFENPEALAAWRKLPGKSEWSITFECWMNDGTYGVDLWR